MGVNPVMAQGEEKRGSKISGSSDAIPIIPSASAASGLAVVNDLKEQIECHGMGFPPGSSSSQMIRDHHQQQEQQHQAVRKQVMQPMITRGAVRTEASQSSWPIRLGEEDGSCDQMMCDCEDGSKLGLGTGSTDTGTGTGTGTGTETNTAGGQTKRGRGKTVGSVAFPLSNAVQASCQVDGCMEDLMSCKDYFRRHKVCQEHARALTVLTAGSPQRFCQQCGRFHTLNSFDEGRKSFQGCINY
ncbi:hypothetical protein CBR_g30039 [Chara braunii]|uniref:SBP-type domain-containing protein n=1 Tax=Chara braunii TaxID=69332 RepID=A0A388LBW0_CHABU|nr:hypothetical protein CBR_g30039 [Chara braunii]|eukprot:GBG79776.1 hypothetical protein CBR_g30039 [Chara braunii]